MGLTLDKNVQTHFDKIETRQKTAFTKEYNKSHKEIQKISGGKAQKMVEEKTESGSEQDSEPEGVLLDEDEMAEIKKAKAEEKQKKKANAAMKRLGMGQELTMIKKVEKEEP